MKKHSIPDPHDLVSAYESFDEVCKDLDDVVDVLWFSGTRESTSKMLFWNMSLLEAFCCSRVLSKSTGPVPS